jgi:hypothetical protein
VREDPKKIRKMPSGYELLFKGTDVQTCKSIAFNLSDSQSDLAGFDETGSFVLQFPALGLGLRGTSEEAASVFCPTISAETLTKNKVTQLYGLKIATGVFFAGAD